MEQRSEPGLRIPTWLVDTVVAAIVLFAALATSRFLSFQLPPAQLVAVTICALIPVPLMFLRRRYPVAVLVTTVLAYGIATFIAQSEFSTFAAVLFALYSAVVTSRRRTGFWIAAATGTAVAGLNAINAAGMTGPAVVQAVLVTAITAAWGDAVRSRRAYTAELRLRAERAEQTLQAQASRAVAEDRLRIARDLHDAVAHQISVISLNAGVANAALDTDTAAARDALRTIRAASRTVLSDIGNLLATLRSPENEKRTPTVGAALLDQLLADFADAGLDADAQIEGDLSSLSSAVDVVLYRVVQEGLTNALKHGSRPQAQLHLRVTSAQVQIVVTNPTTGVIAGTGGHGLTGMSERVESVRGMLQAGSKEGTFRLEAVIPREEPL
ncbi:MAG: sensor histidine kinase [Beutenbergiaceae bacterium]